MGKIENYLRQRGIVVTEADTVRGSADFSVSTPQEGFDLIQKNDAAGEKVFGATATRKISAIGGGTVLSVLFVNGICVSTPDI